MVKRKHKHIPPLTSAQLELALQKVNDDPTLSRAAKRQLAEMLKAAANPASQSVDAIIATLSTARRKDVEDTAASVARATVKTARRGSKALRAMDEAEFNRLVEKANDA